MQFGEAFQSDIGSADDLEAEEQTKVDGYPTCSMRRFGGRPRGRGGGVGERGFGGRPRRRGAGCSVGGASSSGRGFWGLN